MDSLKAPPAEAEFVATLSGYKVPDTSNVTFVVKVVALFAAVPLVDK